MEYCCLVLGVCVSGEVGGKCRFQTNFHQGNVQGDNLTSLLALRLFCFIVTPNPQEVEAVYSLYLEKLCVCRYI